MKILYIHQYYNTPEKGGPLRSFYLSEALVQAGHTVEIITSHNSSKYKLISRKNINVHYLPVKYHNSMGFLSRVRAFYSFVKKGKKLAKSIPDVDLCFATSTPLTVGLLALHLKKKLQIPYIFEVRDLWPEAPVQMGVIKNAYLKKRLYRLELKIYQQAQKIVALSPGIRSYIRTKVPDKPISVITNMSDCHYYEPNIKNRTILKKYGLSDELVITYFGAFGKANELTHLVSCARDCYEHFGMKVRFVLIGEGSEKQNIEKLSTGLKNVKLIPYSTRSELKDLLSITDLSYISFANKPVLESSSPNKFFDSLAAGKGCIINFKGWIKDLIEKQKCGFYHDPSSPTEFVQAIENILADRSILIRYQRNSRQLALDYFSREQQSKLFVEFVNNEKSIASLEPSVYTLTA